MMPMDNIIFKATDTTLRALLLVLMVVIKNHCLMTLHIKINQC
jgi:hypothetical protein